MNNKKFKIVKLCGGLGNQMFQYAFGQELEYRFGCEVLYDDYWFTLVKNHQLAGNNKASHFTVRNYELNLFPIIPKLADRQTVMTYFNADKPQTQDDINKKMMNDTNPFVVNPKMFEDTEIAYYNGYFQTPKYFENVKEKIKKEFTLPEIPKNDKINNKLLKEIQKHNSVFIHIRRGDYINLGLELELTYYQKAIDYMQTHLKNPKFYVFGTDCEDWIKKEFKIKPKFKFIGNHNVKNGEDWKDLKLMQECKHAILANSAFGWWAAYLSDYEGKIVIAPTPWIENEDGIICDNWVKINRK